MYQWLPGQHFLIHHVDARMGDDVSRSMEVVGWDKTRKTLVSQSFDDKGEMSKYACRREGLRWSITGDVVRFEGQFAKALNVLTGLWEMKTTHGGWDAWMDITLTRSD
jgi:hypothetical protein